MRFSPWENIKKIGHSLEFGRYMNKDKEKKIGIFHIGFLYTGTIVGAGFASGREIWQFFGIFGKSGILGLLLTGSIFIFIGIICTEISLALKTDNIVDVVAPFKSVKMRMLIEYSMAMILVLAIVNMSSAAGALINQEFGFHQALGGGILVILVVLTVIGGFERVSHIFQMLMPILIISMIAVSFLVIIKKFPNIDNLKSFHTPIYNNWLISSCMYFSYNMVSAIPIISSGTRRAKNKKKAIWGATLGGFILFFIATLLFLAMATNQKLSEESGLPMLAISKELSSLANILYGLVLAFAIYSSATGNFYGFRQKLKNDENRNKKIVFFGIGGFIIGLAGFKNIVAYMLPLVGICGFFNVIFLIMNFVKIFLIEKKKIV